MGNQGAISDSVTDAARVHEISQVLVTGTCGLLLSRRRLNFARHAPEKSLDIPHVQPRIS